MTASATPPEALERISEWLTGYSCLALRGRWKWYPSKAWSLPIAIQLTGQPSKYVASETVWHLVLSPEGSTVEVRFYPDKDGGISATFPHQTHNGVSDARLPWRAGHPCLELPVARLGRVAWNDEPADLLPRVQWHFRRLIKWIEAAAADELSGTGDPMELPDFRDQLAVGVIGFREIPDGLERMTNETAKWGYARLAKIAGGIEVSALLERQDQAGRTIERFNWSPLIAEAREHVPCVWIRLNGLPVLPPWRRPETWAELNDILASQSISLSDILTKAGIRHRSEREPAKRIKLLLCFPLSERIGEVASKLHWLAINNIPLASKKLKRNGFRSNEFNHRRWDSEISQSSDAIRWQKTMNWASDELRTRGDVGADILGKQFLIIGAGSLGAAVASSLLRMGVTRMVIMDAQDLEMGNLTRHVLAMSDVGHNKARALARHLNSAMPDSEVLGISADFPNMDPKCRASVDTCKVIIDCTASDAVLDAMAHYSWTGEKTFVSLSMSWRASGLFAFSASEASFPALDARTRFNDAPAPAVDFVDARIEGIGCWLPVFPASADDVQLWAGVSCKFIRHALTDRSRRFAYFQQSASGEIECVKN